VVSTIQSFIRRNSVDVDFVTVVASMLLSPKFAFLRSDIDDDVYEIVVDE
jgi:hypothetical protein